MAGLRARIERAAQSNAAEQSALQCGSAAIARSCIDAAGDERGINTFSSTAGAR